MMMTFLGIVLVVLTFINYYPLLVARDFIDSTKEDNMMANATVIANLKRNYMDDVEARAADFDRYVDDYEYDRLLVTDSSATILFDSEEEGSLVGRKAVFSEVLSAVGGSSIFRSHFLSEHFEFSAAVPVLNEAGGVAGSVYLYQLGKSEADTLNTVQQQILLFSLILCLLVLTLSAFFSYLLTNQLRTLSRGVEQMQRGQYGMEVAVETQDELGQLALTFNELNRKLHVTEEKRRAFVSDASHELKTPLASIRLLVDSISQAPQMDPETLRDFLGDIDREIDRLVRITERLFELTRVDSGVEVKQVDIDAGKEVRAALRLLAPLAAERGIRFSYYIEPDCILYGPQDSFSQIAQNLIDNAIKYNNDGGRILVRLDRQGDEVLLRVRDNGVGIPLDDQDKIFDRFYRVEKARSRDTGGTGLGLSIVRANCQLMGGSIDIASEPGVGTQFTARFPAKK